ncbi:nuclear transport factor 2 family protein [Ramlibacter sp.]|uniref:nuclear transport factor 2 family protein n=1 Tax=Ramlibacter sp. TaxID=1917967 RepID=UPI003D0EB27E
MPYNEGMDTSIQTLLDKDQIRDVMLRYCRGVDRRDWEAVRATFFEDGHDDHADFHGVRDEFVAWVSERHNDPGVLKSAHMLSNMLIEFASPEKAVVETYFMAKLELAQEAGGHREMLAKGLGAGNAAVEVLGRYVDRFEKRNGVWKVAKRRTVFDSMHTITVSSDDPRGKTWLLGTRDGEDPLHVARKESGLAAHAIHPATRK